MSDSVRPHRRQPTRLPRPWDSPGKNTGVGCHFLLQCMKVKNESEVAQLCPTLSDSMDCSPPGLSVRGIFPARVLEWDAIAFSILDMSLGDLCALVMVREAWPHSSTQNWTQLKRLSTSSSSSSSREVWCAAFYGVTKSQTPLSDWTEPE